MESSGLCHRCKSGKNLPITIRSCFYYEGPIQQAIHQLKYRRNMSLGSALADSMSGYLEETGWVFDTVLPVPLGVARMNERGYNQAALLAQPIALRFGVEYRPRGLVKIRDTPSQVGLTFDQRQDNVEGAFKAIPAQVAGRSILVIDDVTTSNATLRACAEALVTARANQIYCLTLARPSKR
jgi:ComF family protein